MRKDIGNATSCMQNIDECIHQHKGIRKNKFKATYIRHHIAMRKKSLRINIQNAYDVCVITHHFLLTVCRALVIG
jgi:phosphorylcholine metabolism protein LicD